MDKLHQILKDSKPIKPLWFLSLGAAIVFLFWAIFPYAIAVPIGLKNANNLGDAYGSLNTLFSGLVFAFLAFTLWQQRTQIDLQQQEINQTQELINAQKVELRQQSSILKKQNFESIFFRLLSLHHGIVESMTRIDKDGKVVVTGRTCFYSIYGQLEAHVKQGMPISEAYAKTMSFNQGLGVYFRGSYRIFKFIDENLWLDEENGTIEFDREFYSDFVRALFGNYELIILFYNCAVNKDGIRYKKYAEKYKLFNNIVPNLLFNPSKDLQLVDKQAYGDRYAEFMAYASKPV